MTEVGTVAVLGLGLIGGSAARDLAARGVRVLAWDRDGAAVGAAVGEGIAAAALGDDLAGIEEAGVVLLALPVDAALAVLASAAPRLASARLITDAGSTKRTIVAHAERLGLGARFVGAHPLAGSHASGWAASRAGLFAGAPVYLCRTRDTADDALSLARALWEAMGGRTVEIDAAAHDALLAWSSHLPQAVSTALSGALAERGIARAALGPGGRDVTRLAAGSPEMWSAILLDNRDLVAGALAAAESHLRSLRDAIEAGDRASIRSILQRGRDWASRTDAEDAEN